MTQNTKLQLKIVKYHFINQNFMFIKGYQWQLNRTVLGEKKNFTDNYNCNYGELLPQRSRH